MSDRMQKVRDEVAEGLAHLITATTDTGTAIGEESRRTQELARQRAVQAVQALRGQQPRPSRGRWLTAGLVAGFLTGLTVAWLARSDKHPHTSGAGIADEVRHKGRAAAEAVRDKTATARETAAAKVRNTLPTPAEEDENDDPAERP